MAKTYPMILFIFLFLVAYKADGNSYFDPFKISFFTLWFIHKFYLVFFCKYLYFFIAALTKCETDADCPEISIFSPFFYKCINNGCVLIML